MTKDQAKKYFKIAVLIYLASFLVINWTDISWIFNYKEVSGLVSDFFNPYPSIDASAMDNYFYPNHPPSPKASDGQAANVKITYTDKQNTLEVPKISLQVPIIFSTSADKAALEKDLNSGVVYYPGSVYPGQKGQIIVLGHSAPPGWPKIKHDWVFSELDNLAVGDNIYIDLNNKQYTYTVTKKTIINRGADVPNDSAAADKNVLILISCWPPGKDYQRIAVQAVLTSN